MKELLAGTAIIIVGVGGIVGMSFLGFGMTSYFAPKYEAVRRDVMIESRAYSDASVRRLYDLKREWEAATPQGRATIEAAIRHEFSIFPDDRLPDDLFAFKTAIN